MYEGIVPKPRQRRFFWTHGGQWDRSGPFGLASLFRSRFWGGVGSGSPLAKLADFAFENVYAFRKILRQLARTAGANERRDGEEWQGQERQNREQGQAFHAMREILRYRCFGKLTCNDSVSLNRERIDE